MSVRWDTVFKGGRVLFYCPAFNGIIAVLNVLVVETPTSKLDESPILNRQIRRSAET